MPIIKKTGLVSKNKITEQSRTEPRRTGIFKFFFFPWPIVKWKKLDLKTQNSFYLVFRNYHLKRTRPIAAPAYNIHNPWV